MLSKARAAGVGVALAAGLLLSAARAEPTEALAARDKGKAHHLNPQGEPKGFHKGLPVRYAVWHGKHGWHLRTTTARHKHHFTGHVEVVGGTLTKVHGYHLEKEGPLADYFKVGPRRHRLTFDFETDRGIDGVNFHVSKEAREIRFHLHIDGKGEPGRIYVGHNGQHPEHATFVLPAHPHHKKSAAVKPAKPGKLKNPCK